jgi:hypothetical protein
MKCWDNFLQRMASHQDMPADYWTETQLLGYFCQQTGIKLYYDGSEPRQHQQMKQMKYLIKTFYGIPFFTVDFNALPIKNFIDWCIDKAQEKEHKITTLAYITNEKVFNKLLFIYRNEGRVPKLPEIDFDPAKLDIGDL